MTIARHRPATELGLRPTPQPPSSQHPRWRPWIVPVALLSLGLLIGLLLLTGPAEDLYPVAADSAKYDTIAQGFAHLYAHPIEGLTLWLSRNATAADLQRYGFDSWVLQHAPAYAAYLGLGYLLPGDDVATGRFLTVLLFALGGVLLYLLGRELFGPLPAFGAAVLYLFWPAHWTYAPAILTEIPVAVAALGAAYLLLRTSRAPTWRGWVLGGVALGLLILTKTTLRYLAVPLLLLEFLIDRRDPAAFRVRRLCGRAAGWGGTQAVWLLFLWGFQLSPNPLAHTGDDWLWIYRGNYVPDRGWETVGVGDASTPELMEGIRRAELVPDGERRSATYKVAFLETLRRHPGGMAALVISKAGIFWRFPAVKTDVRAGPLEIPPPAKLQPAMAVAALLGFALCIGAGGDRCLPAAIPIYLTMVHAATHLVGRYNIPAVPFAMVYASGAVVALSGGVRRLLERSRIARKERHRAARDLLLPVLAAAAAIVLVLIGLRLGGVPAVVGPWLALVGFLPILRRLLGGGRWGLVRSLTVLVPLAALTSGAIANDPDPDRGRVTLRRPGDGVRLSLAIPADLEPDRFAAAELLVDMLPSPRRSMTVSLRISGTEVARFAGRPPSGPDAFLLDPEIHGEGDRYRRVFRSVDRQLDGNVRKRRGMSGAGYDQFRQWYRFPVDPAAAFADSEPTIEIVLLETDGATLDLFLDSDVPARGSPARVVEMPAFFENAYELSSYRFDALATDRELADPRLIRPIEVFSRRLGAERFDGSGRRWTLRGEPRMRLRGRFLGGYGLVREGTGGYRAAFLSDPSRAVRMLTPPEIRILQADRDRYVDGYVNF